jgi:hypothetical protein
MKRNGMECNQMGYQYCNVPSILGVAKHRIVDLDPILIDRFQVSNLPFVVLSGIVVGDAIALRTCDNVTRSTICQQQ